MINKTDSKIIIERLDEIKSELYFIKQNIIVVDEILTEDDLSSLNHAEWDFKEGKTKRI